MRALLSTFSWQELRHHPWRSLAAVAAGVDPATLSAGEVMSTDLVTAREDDSLIDLMRVMRRKGVRRVPVVGGQGELIGLATLDDLLAILAEELSLLVAAIDSEGQRERRMRPGA